MCVITDARPSYDKKKLYLYEIVIKVAQSFENVPPLSAAVGNVRFFIVKIRVIISLVTSALTKKNRTKSDGKLWEIFSNDVYKSVVSFLFRSFGRESVLWICVIFFGILYCAFKLLA